MSRATVRAAVADWFTTDTIPDLNKVSRSEPVNFWASDVVSQYDLTGAVAYVHLNGESEHRITGPASHGGWKRVDYDVGLVINYRSRNLDPSGANDAGELAMDGFDTMIEAIKTRLRSDFTLGGAVWAAGEGGAQQRDDITVAADLPVATRQDVSVMVRGVVQFTITEWIQA